MQFSHKITFQDAIHLNQELQTSSILSEEIDRVLSLLFVTSDR